MYEDDYLLHTKNTMEKQINNFVYRLVAGMLRRLNTSKSQASCLAEGIVLWHVRELVLNKNLWYN